MSKSINYKGFWTMLALMFGFTIFSASVMSGADIARDLKLWQGAIAILVGNAILATYGAVLAYVSKKKDKNLDGLLKESFGKKGAIIPSMIMILTQIGWFGVGVAMIAKPLAGQLGTSPWLIAFIAAALMVGSAIFGIKSLTILSMIAVPLVLILGIVSTGISVNTGTLDETVYKFNSTNIFQAIAVVIGTFISGATFVPNFAKEAKSTSIAWKTTALAFFVGNGIMITFGFVAQAFSQNRIFDFISIATGHGQVLLGFGYLIIILNIWTTNDSGLYSISLGIEHWIKIPKKIGVAVVGIIGAAASLWLFDNFIEFLSYMNRFVPGIGAIMMANYLKKDLKETEFDFVALITFLGVTGLTFIPGVEPYAPFVTFGLSFIIYLCAFKAQLRLGVVNTNEIIIKKHTKK